MEFEGKSLQCDVLRFRIKGLPYLLIPWSRVLLEKLTGCQLVKKFTAFYGTRMLIIAFTSARPTVSVLIQIDPVHGPSRSFLILSYSENKLFQN